MPTSAPTIEPGRVLREVLGNEGESGCSGSESQPATIRAGGKIPDTTGDPTGH